MKPIYILSLFLLLCSGLCIAQSAYQISGVRVIQHGDTLRNAWTGGFNNPIFSPIDLDQDGLMDLFVYDKAGWKALSFINTGSVGHPSFSYAPQYDRTYPALQDWAEIRDYNHDGVGDILALSQGGYYISAYRGSRAGSSLSYSMSYSTLNYTIADAFGTITDPISTFSDNLPVMMDLNANGTLDILSPDVNAVTLDFFKNVAVDSGYGPDSLVFRLASQCWGHFAEDVTDCNVTLDTCSPDRFVRGQGQLEDRNLRHQGGACTGFNYIRNSNVVSLFIADIYCNTTKFLRNVGDSANADMGSVDTLFPSYDLPVDLPLFPALYMIDADNDGFDDILAAPFASNAYTPNQSEDINVVRYYHNNAGTDSVNTFHYEGDTLFNNSMVDVGTESHPVFFDYNGDGLMDMVAGRFGQLVSPGSSRSSLELYENIGTDTMPVYQLVDTDWNHLSALDIRGLYPAFGDLDGDGLPDMVVGDSAGNINFLHNAGTATGASYPAVGGPIVNSSWFGISVADDAAPFIYDVNGDGLNDLVIGSGGVNVSLIASDIYYYWNFGTPTHPQFSPDSVNDFFGNIIVWDSSLGVVEGFPTPVIIKENNVPVLYTGSFGGKIFKYAIDPDSLRSGSFVQLSSDVLGVSPGRFATVSIADINHDGKNDYLTGNIRGGIMLFSDAPWSSSATNGIAEIPADNKLLEVFPNPARDKVTCRLPGGGAALASAQLYDLLGEPISVPVEKGNNNTIILSVNKVAEGIYVIQAGDSDGRSYQSKIAIFNK